MFLIATLPFLFVLPGSLQGGVKRFAEIIVGSALGLDLSTLSAIASGQFASAHNKLGRNHPDLGVKVSHINDDLFAKVVGPLGKLVSWAPGEVRFSQACSFQKCLFSQEHNAPWAPGEVRFSQACSSFRNVYSAKSIMLLCAGLFLFADLSVMPSQLCQTLSKQ